MPEYLRLWLTYNHRRDSKKVEIQGSEIAGQEMRLSANRILRYVKDFLFEGNQSVTTFLTVWIDIKGIRQNLFKLKKKKTDLRLTLNDHGYFQLNVFIVDGSQKNNIIKNYQLNYDSYQRLKNNMERVIVESKQEEKQGDQQRPIDIAYFFADPLVSVTKKLNNLQIKPLLEVSYQVEYDQFINMVKKEELRLNFRIEMMVATETNIKNTLLEGASLLHFACHGKSGILEIQHEKQIGELANLSSDRLMDILENKTLPKAIIFNVCHSFELARRISHEKKIMTIGYDGQANDRYCQQFTKEFYMGIFRDGRTIRQVFNQIKQNITEKDPYEGKKLRIFPEEKSPLEVLRISQSKPSSKQFIIRWSILESLRGNDTLGVKKQMYKLIKKLINDERMSYLFLEGDKHSGKTSLINKTRIYVLNRKVFTDQFYFDLNKQNGQPIETMLELKLALETSFIAWRNQMKRKGKEGRVASLIILDHAQRIMMYQYAELTKYIENEMRDKLTYGKIVIITRKRQPASKREAQSYSKAIKHIKQPCDIKAKEFSIFVSRYWQQYKEQAIKLNKQKRLSLIDIVKGIKHSQKVEDIEVKAVEASLPLPSSEPEYIQKEGIQMELQRIGQETERLLRDMDVQIVENHHIYVSTIFEEIADRDHQSSHGCKKPQIKEQIKEQKKNDVIKLVNTFKNLFQRTILHQQFQAVQYFKQFARQSLKIAGVCYILDVCFQKHIMNCDKMYIMANAMLIPLYISVPLRVSRRESQAQEENMIMEIEGKQLDELLKQYKLKILLTLYTYYTQSHFRLLEVMDKSEDIRQTLEQRSKKVGIVLNELYITIQKRSKEHEIQLKEGFLRKYIQLNTMIQQIRYSPEFGHERSPKVFAIRKNSDIFNASDPDMTSISTLTNLIHIGHKKIEQYWKLFEELLDNNHHFEILSKDSLVIMELTVIKLININQMYLQHLESKGQNYIKRDMQGYVQNYATIMQTIEQSNIFGHDNKSHSQYIVWKFPNSKSIKAIFRRYFQMFIDAYFHVEKLLQNITKNYEIKIFNQLLQLSDSHPKFKLKKSIKKEIQTHKEEQFLSNYCCETYISLPLLKFRNIDDNVGQRVNIKRFESHIYRFQEEFFATLDREIKNDIFSLGKQFFDKQQQESKSLIQLIILNCSDTTVQCEDVKGKGEILRIKQIERVPKAPVIILFGCNVKSLVGKFREWNNTSVLITINLGDEEHPNEKDFLEKNFVRENWPQKEQRIKKLQDYVSRLEISYTVLEFFYTSFCKHFFSVDHVLFLEQVKSSYYLAKAETLMKTKIRLQTGSSYEYSDFIKDSVNQNIQISISEQELKDKTAYHFMFKHYKIENFAKIFYNLSQSEKEKREIQGEIGCNRDICRMLQTIEKAKQSESHIILYKSKEMLHQYVTTLISKLQKYKKYEVILTDLEVPENLEMSRTSSVWASRVDQQNEENEDIKTTRVIIFEDLPEYEILEEIKSIPSHQQRTIRLFFSNTRQKMLLDYCKQSYIMETYKDHKIQFEIYMIDCKNRKPPLLHKSCMSAFKKLTEQESFSLAQIKREIQNKHH